MKNIDLFIVLQMMLLASFGQTHNSSALYVHFGYGSGSSAVQVLCIHVRFGEPILVMGADLRNIRPWNNWKLG
jgi:hypothetical protein